MDNFGLTNKYDAYKKCIRILRSCENIYQVIGVWDIARLHYDLYDDNYLYMQLENEKDFMYHQFANKISINNEHYELPPING